MVNHWDCILSDWVLILFLYQSIKYPERCSRRFRSVCKYKCSDDIKEQLLLLENICGNFCVIPFCNVSTFQDSNYHSLDKQLCDQRCESECQWEPSDILRFIMARLRSVPLLLLVLINTSDAFNIDTKNLVIQTGPRDSCDDCMFGFSVAQHSEAGVPWWVILLLIPSRIWFDHMHKLGPFIQASPAFSPLLHNS